MLHKTSADPLFHFDEDGLDISITHRAVDSFIGGALLAGMGALAMFAGCTFGIWAGFVVAGIACAAFLYCMCASAGRADERMARMLAVEDEGLES